MRDFLSLDGRLSRSGYFVKNLISGLAFVAFLFTVAFWQEMRAPDSDNVPASVWMALIMYAFYGAKTTVLRLHDLGKPASHFWLELIPIYNVYLSLVLLLKPGMVGANEYGFDPLQGPEPEDYLIDELDPEDEGFVGIR